MHTLQYYADLIRSGKICYTGTKNAIVWNECSIKGLALEIAVADALGLPMTISMQKQTDIIFTGDDGKRHFMEVKSNSSPLENCIGRNSVMAYAFYVNLDKPLCKQWGYVMNFKQWFEIGLNLNHIKSGTTAGGTHSVEYKTQTVWNNSKNEMHGKKALKLEDAYIAAGALSFAEFFK